MTELMTPSGVTQEAQDDPRQVAIKRGVTPWTYDFMTAAARLGADAGMEDAQRKLLLSYFESDKSVNQLADELDMPVGRVIRQLRGALGYMWRQMPDELKAEFPAGVVLKLKSHGGGREKGFDGPTKENPTSKRMPSNEDVPGATARAHISSALMGRPSTRRGIALPKEAVAKRVRETALLREARRQEPR